MRVEGLAFRTDLRLRELAGSVITERPAHLVVRTPGNPHFWWGNFVLVPPAALPDALGVFRAELPDAAHLAIGVDGAPDLGSVREAVGGWGLGGVEIGHDTVLTAAGLRRPDRPADAELRPLEPGDWTGLAALRQESDTDEPTPENDAFAAAKIAEEERLCAAGTATWFGAFTGGRIRAALGIVPDGHGLARYQHVETHPELRRRGLASSLVHYAGEHALRSHARTLVIVADPEAEAIGLYRRLGFTETEHQTTIQRAPGATGTPG